MRHHLFHIVIATLLVLAVCVSFNRLIDPYQIWNYPQIQGINTVKHEQATHERIFKTLGLARYPADTVILGTSRSDIGLNPEHPALGQHALNLAIAAQPYRETRMLFDAMIDKAHTKTFIIGLDYLPSDGRAPLDFTTENFDALRAWELMLSISTLKDAIRTVAGEGSVYPGNTWSSKGLRLFSAEYVKAKNGHRSLMRGMDETILSKRYLWTQPCSQAALPKNVPATPLEEIRDIFSRAHREHIKLKLFISPSHAHYQETLALSGQWQKWEAWKRLLMQLNETEAKRVNQEPFPLWDFSGYHTMLTENVPRQGDTQTMMQWHFDSIHYTPAMGDLVLDRMFYSTSPKRVVPDDFGVLLSRNNIEAHLATLRAGRQIYRQNHIDDVTEIEEIAREIAKEKRCR